MRTKLPRMDNRQFPYKSKSCVDLQLQFLNAHDCQEMWYECVICRHFYSYAFCFFFFSTLLYIPTYKNGDRDVVRAIATANPVGDRTKPLLPKGNISMKYHSACDRNHYDDKENENVSFDNFKL